MLNSDKSGIKNIIKEKYGEIARDNNTCCNTANLFCGRGDVAEQISKKVGYQKKDLENLPEGANLGLGCGNPVAIASLKEGETVLDLGSGAGIDCFLAANQVGKKGRVIGVDMTPEMIEKARSNAKEGNFGNVEFRLGEIENLPLEDNTIDVVISNCVINLSPEIIKVFQETYRVLRPGGRLMVSDIVLEKDLPLEIKNSIEAYVGCIAGASLLIKSIRLRGEYCSSFGKMTGSPFRNWPRKHR